MPFLKMIHGSRGSLGKCPHFGPKLLVPSAGWNQIFRIFTGSGHPFIHLSILLQSLWKTLLQVMVRGTTDRQTLFRCQEAYSVLITYNMLSSMEFVFLLLKLSHSCLGPYLVWGHTFWSTGRVGLWMSKSRDKDQKGSALSPYQD